MAEIPYHRYFVVLGDEYLELQFFATADEGEFVTHVEAGNTVQGLMAAASADWLRRAGEEGRAD